MTDASAPPAFPRWPDVPACYGWLALDRRGRWRLRGEPITHAGLRSAIATHYACDAAGAWFFRNGPQRVYVDLECAPWILRLAPGGRLLTHTGREDAVPRAVWIDDAGTVYLETSIGAGVLEGTDLAEFTAGLASADGTPATDAVLDGWLAGASPGPRPALVWTHAGRALPVGHVAAPDAPTRLGFVSRPRGEGPAG